MTFLSRSDEVGCARDSSSEPFPGNPWNAGTSPGCFYHTRHEARTFSNQLFDITETCVMAASARTKGILVSPATSNDVKFERKFEHVFRTSSLHDAFKNHPAFNAVFEDEQESLFRR